MRVRQVLCPSCGVLLGVPPGASDCFVRCGHCRFRFRLPKRIAVTEDTISDWLEEGKSEGPEHAPEKAASHEQQTADLESTAVLPAVSDAIRLVKSDASGALFEFPSSRLLDPAFRCAMPRSCTRCGAATHLAANVIVYGTNLIDGMSQETDRIAGSLVLKGDDLRSLSNEDLCKRLPRVPDVPPPADLPMPYWLCDMCTAKDLVTGQIRLNPNTGVGLCRLWIGNLRVAEEFFLAVGGKGTAGQAELQHRITATSENPWGLLSVVVQNRLQQWYKPQHGEHFLAYIPDRDRTRTEDGMAGIVVSNRRMICHNLMRHREAMIAETLELEEVAEEGRHRLRIKSPSWEIRHLAVDREGLLRFREALVKGMFKVMWR
jgi:hypothetical protein